MADATRSEPDGDYYDYVNTVDENLNCPICRCALAHLCPGNRC